MRADNLKFQVICRYVEYVDICVANMRYYYLLDEEEEVDQQPPSTSTHSERMVNNHHPENGNTKDINGVEMKNRDLNANGRSVFTIFKIKHDP